MKLSKNQQLVIDKMRAGWSLGRSNYGDSRRAWLQKNGLGYGGECIDVRADTFKSLWNKKLIKSKGYQFPTEEYTLA